MNHDNTNRTNNEDKPSLLSRVPEVFCLGSSGRMPYVGPARHLSPLVTSARPCTLQGVVGRLLDDHALEPLADLWRNLSSRIVPGLHPVCPFIFALRLVSARVPVGQQNPIGNRPCRGAVAIAIQADYLSDRLRVKRCRAGFSTAPGGRAWSAESRSIQSALSRDSAREEAAPAARSARLPAVPCGPLTSRPFSSSPPSSSSPPAVTTGQPFNPRNRPPGRLGRSPPFANLRRAPTYTAGAKLQRGRPEYTGAVPCPVLLARHPEQDPDVTSTQSQPVNHGRPPDHQPVQRVHHGRRIEEFSPCDIQKWNLTLVGHPPQEGLRQAES